MKIFQCDGGHIVLPKPSLVLMSREDGGNLLVNPPREVWERSELNPDELTKWSFLVSATGRAMLDVLPQLTDGCINYWEAGNWALNEQAEPVGPKTPRLHRKMHLHLLGRSRTAPRWGDAPRFPDFTDRFSWSSAFERLSPEECRAIVIATETALRSKYGLPNRSIAPWSTCAGCGYPTCTDSVKSHILCEECTNKL